MENIIDKVKCLVSEVSGIPVEELISNVPMEEIGLNSITFIEIIVKLEQDLDIIIDDEDLDLSRFQTLDDLYEVIEKEF